MSSAATLLSMSYAATGFERSSGKLLGAICLDIGERPIGTLEPAIGDDVDRGIQRRLAVAQAHDHPDVQVGLDLIGEQSRGSGYPPR